MSSLCARQLNDHKGNHWKPCPGFSFRIFGTQQMRFRPPARGRALAPAMRFQQFIADQPSKESAVFCSRQLGVADQRAVRALSQDKIDDFGK